MPGNSAFNINLVGNRVIADAGLRVGHSTGP